MTHLRLVSSSCAAALAVALASPAAAGEVQGFVVDATDTVALQAAEVRIVELGRSAAAERDGSFYFEGIPAGDYTVVVTYPGVDPVTRTITVPDTGIVTENFQMGGEEANPILVIGQRANLASALARKRAADGISDVITRDAIGQFPDQNVAESLRRLPGINVLNDQGEGRFVSVRGLDPELNATSLNGVRLPSPESDVRSVALDVISSDIIESIEVKKSLTPDMDADTIGASIEIKTTSAFDRKKDLLTAKVEGSYNEFSGEITPKASIDFATRLTDNLGISGGLSYYNRKFETDNIEADGWELGAGGPFATEVQYRDYDVERERISGTLNVDIRASDSTELYIRGVYSRFDDQEFRRRLTFDLGDFDGGASSQSGSIATFSDADEEFTVESDVKDRFERQEIGSVVIGGETEANGWLASYSLAYSKSTEREDGSVDPTQFEQDFDNDGLTVTFDYADPRVPLFSVSGATDRFSDPQRYELNDVELTALSDAQDEEWAAKFDVGREFYTGAGDIITLQGGFKGRWRDKSFNKDVEFYENGNYTLDQVLGTPTYRITDISPLADKQAPTNFFFSNFSDFDLVPVDSQFDSAVEDYSVSENIYAGYLLGKWESSTVRAIAGVRVEHTDNDIIGNVTTLIEEDGMLPDGTIAADDTVIVTPGFFTKDYTDWLPSVNVRWEAKDNFIVRLAGYKSLVRPRLSRLASRFAVEEADDGEREGEFGNPDLEPFKAWNFDASFEYYMSNNGGISAAVFYKDVKNFIVDVTVDQPGTFRGLAFNEAQIPINGPSGEIFGVELSYSQSLDFLPGLLSGLLVQANYTYTDATGLVPVGEFADIQSVDTFREITLPSTSKHTFNGVLGYEKGPLSIRLAGTYRDKYLDEIGGDDPADDRLVDDHFQLDLSAKYKINKNVKLFYEWVNINNAKFFAYNTLGGQQNNLQYEEYNWTMKFGARVTF